MVNPRLTATLSTNMKQNKMTYNEVETLLAEARALLAEARAVLAHHGRPLADIPEDMPNVSEPPLPFHPDLAPLTVSSIYTRPVTPRLTVNPFH